MLTFIGYVLLAIPVSYIAGYELGKVVNRARKYW